MYVIFEGVDTSGKSTQVELFSQREQNVVVTKEPGGTNLGVKLREILLQSEEKLSFTAELLLFLADRAEHYDKVVKPNQQKIIISDRGFISGIAYALANNSHISLDFLISLNRFALGEHLPQKVVLFKTDYELITTRLGNKQRDTIEQRGIEYLLRVQSLMEDVLKSLNIDYLAIDANHKIEDIYKQIQEYIYR
jgi:dTMP kinase